MSTTLEDPTFTPSAERFSLSSVVPREYLRYARVVLMFSYLIGYLWWLRVRGFPIDRISVAISVGMFLVCAFVGKSWRTWGILLLDCLFYCFMWLAYERTRGVADEGITVFGLFHMKFPLQVETMRNIDRVLFFGHDPNVVLQHHFYTKGVVRWYDVVASVTYMTHFVFPIVVMAVLWATSHRQWLRFMRRFSSLLLVACVMFVVFPTAPPWMVSKQYHLIGDLQHSITSYGIHHIGFHGLAAKYKVALSNGNAVAAMPSLHASFALIVPAFFLPWIRWTWLKVVVLSFPVIMLVSLVYFGEHWVIDGLVGWAITGGCFWFWGRVEQRTRDHRSALARAHLHQAEPALAGAADA